MEKELRIHREEAIRLLQENRSQARDGVELLVRDRLGSLVAAAHPTGPALSVEQIEALYQEVIDLSYVMFSFGYSFAHTAKSGASR